MAGQSPQAGSDAGSSFNNASIDPTAFAEEELSDVPGFSDSEAEFDPDDDGSAAGSEFENASHSKLKRRRSGADHDSDSEPEFEPHAPDSDAESDSEFEKREKNNNGRIVWTNLAHYGVYFPPEYERYRPLPRTVRLIYAGKPVELPPEAEEIAYSYAKVQGEWYGKRARFKANFFGDLNAALVRCGRPQLQNFKQCDFGLMREYYLRQQTRPKYSNKRHAHPEEKYRWCCVDGELLQVLYYMLDPPGLFVGRHRGVRYWGKFVHRVRPEEITVNISPEYRDLLKPPYGNWKAVISDRTQLWLAKYKHPVLGLRYVRLAGHHRWGGWQREFQVALDLGNYLWRIRADYEKDMRSTLTAKREVAVVLWLVDLLGFRLKTTRGHPEFDYDLGLASLQCAGIVLSALNMVEIRFTGPYGLVYAKTVRAPPTVYVNLQLILAGKGPEDPVFSRSSLRGALDRMSRYRRALTATTFRAFSFSRALQLAIDEYEASVIYKHIPRTQVARVEVFNQIYRKVSSIFKMTPQVPLDRDHENSRITLYKWAVYRLKMKLKAIDPAFEVGEVMDVETYRQLGDRYAHEIEERFSRTLKIEIEEETAAGVVQLQNNHTIPNDPAYVWDLIYDKMLLIDIERLRIVCPDYDADLHHDRLVDPRICVAYAKRHNVPIPRLVRNTVRTRWAYDTPPDFRY